MSEQKKQSIGALWVKQGKSGDFFTGNIEVNGQKIKIAIFKNDYKKDKQPDFRIFVDDYEPQSKQPYEHGNAAGKLSDSNNVSLDSDLPF